MRCPRCGYQNSNGSTYCGNCGSRLGGHPKRRRWFPVIMIVIAVCAIIAVLGYGAVRNAVSNTDGSGVRGDSLRRETSNGIDDFATADVVHQEEGKQVNGHSWEELFTGTGNTKDFKLSAGDVVTFGNYEQDNNRHNGAEPIQWNVLDVQENKALLLSLYALDSQPYNRSYGPSTWEECTLRSWLNSTFLEAAFTAEEKASILMTEVDNSRLQNNKKWNVKVCDNTEDLIFLLSYADTDRYFANEAARICTPTNYAVSMGADVRTLDDGITGAGWWWLRSPGEDSTQASFVNFDGTRYTNYVGNEYLSVRPALWFDLEMCGSADGSELSVCPTETKSVAANRPVLKADYEISTDKEMLGEPIPVHTVFGSTISRECIDSIQFLNSLADAPKDAWDVSEAEDGSVLAWVTPTSEYRYDLFIAGEGGVWAPEDCTYLFAEYRWMESLDFNNAFFVENCKTMQGMFYHDQYLTELDFHDWDTSSVENMREMFCFCSSLEQLDLSRFHTSSVTNMRDMFMRCESMKELDLSSFDTSSVTDMSGMFFQSWYLEKLNLSSFDTSKVANIGGMFFGCESLKKLDISSFDTSSAEESMGIFSGSLQLSELKVGSKFDVSILREEADRIPYMTEGGTINGYPWESFLKQ